MGKPKPTDPKILQAIRIMALSGCTDAQISAVIGISERTFRTWKHSFSEELNSLSDWKATADEKVERALFELAIGYETIETKVHFSPVLSKKLDLTNGTDLLVNEALTHVITHDVIKRYAPKEKSIQFWLKNRQPDKWREKIVQEIETTDKDINFTIGFK